MTSEPVGDPGVRVPLTDDENPGPPDDTAELQDSDGDPSLHNDDDSDDTAGGDDLETADGDD